MYTLNHIDRYRFQPSASASPSDDVYVLAIDRIASDGIVSISSDQQLSLFRPSAGLSVGPTASWATQHGNLTSLGVFDWQSGLVCTAGEDGSVGVWDLRIAGAGGKVAQFKGEFSQLPCGEEVFSKCTDVLTRILHAYSEPSSHLVHGM